MAIANLRIEAIAKIVCIVVLSWHMGLEGVHSRAVGPDNYRYSEPLAKEPLIGKTCLLILGGSNARNALSAAQLSAPGCPALNLAVTDEMGDFNRYRAWLAKGAQADVVIYSPLYALSSSPPAKAGLFDQFRKMAPLITRAKNIYSGQKEVFFTENGDISHYNCDSQFIPHDFDPVTFDLYTPAVISELARRVSVLKSITRARLVIVHMPRIYVYSQDHRILKVIQKRQAAIRRAGIALLDTTVVYSDRSLFCDQFHANGLGRHQFSADVAGALSKSSR